MATRAEQHKVRTQRKANPPKPKAKTKPKKASKVDTAQPGVSATDRKVGGGSTAGRNKSKRAAKKGRAVLEDSKTGRPSRKSTRKSATRTKAATSLSRRATRKTTSPKARARRSIARKR